ncbi:Transient receptor potential cation channel subfamily V member [Trichinella pseudospiralis]
MGSGLTTLVTKESSSSCGSRLHKQHQEQAAKVELGACLVPLATGAAHFVAVDGQFQFSAAHLMHCMQLSQPANTSGYLDNCGQKCQQQQRPGHSSRRIHLMRFFWKRYHDRKPADPDSKWTNLSREYERNNLYKWLQRKKPGSLIEIYEQEGRDGVLRFAEEKIVPMLHNEGQRPEIVREIDYIKWRKFMSTNLNENAEKEDKDQEVMQSIQFQEHQALWRLNRRGVKGETLAHLLLSSNEQRCAEIARILICEYPHLALDIYEDEEMYGQSCLHLAILHNDYDTACLLLQCGASAVQRATGRFFWPNKNGTSAAKESTQYEGLAYFGEYPLAFAASFGNKDIYDALIDFNADPNAQDTYGNTVLHMCVIHNSIVRTPRCVCFSRSK